MNASDDAVWVKIVHRSLARSCFISETNPDSFPNWKKEWFYVYLDAEESRDSFFRPNFSKSIHGSLRDLKLGIDEDAAIQALIANNLHHCALILSEGNLQALVLSDLGPEGIFPSFSFVYFLYLLFLLLIFSRIFTQPRQQWTLFSRGGRPRLPGELLWRLTAPSG